MYEIIYENSTKYEIDNFKIIKIYFSRWQNPKNVG